MSISLKKKLLSIICLLLISAALHSSAQSISSVTGFTHPEIGEFIVYGLDNDMPFFTIYGFTQYKIMNPNEPYRGIQSLDKKKQLELHDMLDKFFENIDNKKSEHAPVIFEYTGLLEDYTAQLDALTKEERIKAISLLAGFEGKKSFTKLRGIDGFQDIDLDYFEENFDDYTIELEGKTTPYRVLMFYIEEENWEESYFERYSFIRQGSQWNLMHIAKEYASEYRQRNKYIHGLAGMTLETYVSEEQDILRGYNWFSTQDSVSALENVPSLNNTIHIDNVKVFRLPADITFTFQNEWLSSVEYTFRMPQSYYSAFVSLYMRYYDPVTILPNGNMFWSLPDMTIELIFEGESPLLRLSPRMDLETISVG